MTTKSHIAKAIKSNDEMKKIETNHFCKNYKERN